MAGLKRVMDGYDCGIRYTDTLVGEMLDLLRAQGIYDDTAIIITSDHGENMGELAIYSEHATADYPTCHIPFILKWPGGKAGISDSGFHYSLDLLPTMAQLLGVKPWEKTGTARALRRRSRTARPPGATALCFRRWRRRPPRPRAGDWPLSAPTTTLPPVRPRDAV